MSTDLNGWLRCVSTKLRGTHRRECRIFGGAGLEPSWLGQTHAHFGGGRFLSAR